MKQQCNRRTYHCRLIPLLLRGFYEEDRVQNRNLQPRPLNSPYPIISEALYVVLHSHNLGIR